jgi:hypothetical protein
MQYMLKNLLAFKTNKNLKYLFEKLQYKAAIGDFYDKDH